MPRLAVGKKNFRLGANPHHIERTVRTARIGYIARMRLEGANRPVPHIPQLEEAILSPSDIRLERGGIADAALFADIGAHHPPKRRSLTHIRQVKTRRRLEIAPATVTIANAMPRPAVRKDAVHRIKLHDLTRHVGHILKVIRPQRTRHPQLRVGPMAHRLTIRPDHDPLRMGIIGVLMHCMWVGARNDIHAQLATPLIEFAKGIAIAHPRRAIVKGDLGRIIADAAPRAQTGRVAMRPLKEIQPKIDIVANRIMLGERQLCPTHGAVKPVFLRWRCNHLSLLAMSVRKA